MSATEYEKLIELRGHISNVANSCFELRSLFDRDDTYDKYWTQINTALVHEALNFPVSVRTKDALYRTILALKAAHKEHQTAHFISIGILLLQTLVVGIMSIICIASLIAALTVSAPIGQVIAIILTAALCVAFLSAVVNNLYVICRYFSGSQFDEIKAALIFINPPPTEAIAIIPGAREPLVQATRLEYLETIESNTESNTTADSAIHNSR